MSLAGLSLRDLEYIVAVGEHRHFSRAAAACAVSQPALSGQIRKIEGLLRVTVFERDRRHVMVTRKGEVVLRQARRVLHEAHRLVELARVWDEPLAGPLALGAIATLGPYLFPYVLGPLRERFPSAELILSEARTAELLDQLGVGKLDAALLCLPIRRDGLSVRPLFFEPFLLIHPPDHPLSQLRPLTVAGLSTEGLLLLEEGHCLRDQALALCGATGAAERRHAAGLETLRHMVAAGAGYSIVPALAAMPHAMLDGLVSYTPFDEADAGCTVALVWRTSDPRSDQYDLLADFFAAASPPGTRPAALPRPPEEAHDRAQGASITPSHRDADGLPGHDNAVLGQPFLDAA
jgi:LysR family transcriptional regulator, hydrogen peroxide-inducible genes activator